MSEKDLIALEKAAYAAPWTVEYDSYRDDERWVVKADCTPVAFCDEKEEAITLAGMRNMLPELLSALTATRAELERLRATNGCPSCAAGGCDEYIHLPAPPNLVAEMAETRAELTRAQKAAGQMLDIVMELRKAAPAAAPQPDEPTRNECPCGGRGLTCYGFCGLPRTCPNEYTRPGGRQRGDRIVRCHLPAGHTGEHEEADTERTWLNADDAGAGDGEQDTATTAHALERTTQTPNGLTWWARCTCGFPSVPTTSAYEAELKIAEHHERVKRATTCCEGTA
jgi:hypothetical protein